MVIVSQFHPTRQMQRRSLAVVVASIVGLAVQLAPALANPVLPPVAGVWIDDTGQGAVEIQPCGTALCGRIVWLQSPTNGAGKPLTDQLNPRASQRSRAICGLQVIGDVARQSDGSWDAGWIYDPKQGKAFDVALDLDAPDRLRVTGYLGTKFLSKTFIWTRASAPLSRCAVNQALMPSR